MSITVKIREIREYFSLSEKQLNRPLSLAERARIIAEQAHKGDTRISDEQPYFVHPERMAKHPSLRTDKERAIALLHDVLEKTWMPPETLRALGIPKGIVNDVQKLSIKGDPTRHLPYFDGIEQILTNKRVKKVRKVDIEDNLSDREAYTHKLEAGINEGYTANITRLARQNQRWDTLYPLAKAFLKAAEVDPKIQKLNIIEFMRRPECPERFRENWRIFKDENSCLLSGKELTSHTIPEDEQQPS